MTLSGTARRAGRAFKSAASAALAATLRAGPVITAIASLFGPQYGIPVGTAVGLAKKVLEITDTAMAPNLDSMKLATEIGELVATRTGGEYERSRIYDMSNAISNVQTSMQMNMVPGQEGGDEDGDIYDDAGGEGEDDAEYGEFETLYTRPPPVNTRPRSRKQAPAPRSARGFPPPRNTGRQPWRNPASTRGKLQRRQRPSMAAAPYGPWGDQM